MRRAVAFPILALLVVALVAAANHAVYQAGMEWFVQKPSILIVARNVLAVVMVLAGGWILIPASGRHRSLENALLIGAALFGLGLAVQFRLGHDAPRQLSNAEIDAVQDSVARSMAGRTAPEIAREATRDVRRRNSQLRRDFEAARVDTRLARSLESAYGETALTRGILADRAIAPMDNPVFRFLPVVAALVAIGFAARGDLAVMLPARWRMIGFYGSLAICLLTVIYLTTVGGVRGANYAPQEILKLTLPIAWTGFLIHYRGALQAETRERFTTSPLVLWLYILGLLTLPLLVFVVMRDFGQFLVIGIAQVLLLAYFTRSALYIVLFVAALLATSVIVMSGSAFAGSALLTVLAIVLGSVLLIAALERFRRRDVLWTSASFVLAGYIALVYLAVQLPYVSRIIATPRQRFLLWADLYSRRGNAAWWDQSRQIIESLYAFDAGGLLGRGLGHGSPFLIPKASSDFIFAAIGEELGAVGAALVVLAFGALAAIGLRIARNLGRDSFTGLLVAGYTLLLVAQAFVHITGTMNLLPMTGITLPLVSSGMSSLVVTWAMLGLIVGLAAQEGKTGKTIVIRSRSR